MAVRTVKRQHSSSPIQGKRLEATCAKLLGVPVTELGYPGGQSRRSCRVHLADGQTVIATQRAANRSRIENRVLRALSERQAPVPRLLAVHDRLLLQEDIPGERLSIAMAHAVAENERVRSEAIFASALDALAAVQRAGSQAGLDRRVPLLGASRAWLVEFLKRPALIGKHLGCPTPRPELDRLLERFAPREPRFVKWDARPGNAMVRTDQRVIWFDWEHCGARNRIDDLAWLLGDEFFPDLPDLEKKLLEEFLPEFADGLSHSTARDYFYTYGVFHSSVRLGLILHHKRNKPWWNYDKCLCGDKIGVTQGTAQRLCERAARWARQSPLTAVLGPWFESIIEPIQALPIDG